MEWFNSIYTKIHDIWWQQLDSQHVLLVGPLTHLSEGGRWRKNGGADREGNHEWGYTIIVPLVLSEKSWASISPINRPGSSMGDLCLTPHSVSNMVVHLDNMFTVERKLCLG
jgi:hypothetical protein